MKINIVYQYLKFFSQSGSNHERLKGEEKEIYSLLMDSGGVMFQSKLVEQSKLPKASVSLILSRLEAEGLLEKRRQRMSNLIVLK
jgi:uncharacterized membrane protein